MDKIDNFRDFGGYPTQSGLAIKKGLFYRSGGLAAATHNDVKQLAELGIQTIIDLRSNYERERETEPDIGIKTYPIPIQVKQQDNSGALRQLYKQIFGPARHWDYAQKAVEMYCEYVTDFGEQFSQVIRLVLEADNLPVLIHCTAGKDRTGYAVSLIHLLLGVPADMIFQDYLLSNELLGRFRAEMIHRLRFYAPLGLSAQRFLPLFDARREYLQAAFDEINSRYGSFDNYFVYEMRISEEDRRQFQRRLLE